MTISTQDEIAALEKNLDELSESLSAIAGDPDAIAKTEADAADEEEIAEIAAQVDAIADDLNVELNKRTNESWDAAVTKIAADENLAPHVALSVARVRFPDLFGALQKSGP